MGSERRFIGHYEVLSLLGKGGMGEVFRARDSKLDRDVAIKILPPSVSEDPERLRRFRREALAAASLNHPNVVTIYEGGESDGERYLVMEVVEGETLRDRLDRKPLSLNEALDIAIQLADGLTHAHEAGVVHRDFKPRNIIIKPDGHAKILDFGLGKRIGFNTDQDATIDDGSIPGVLLGTVDYMAPEQVCGEAIDHRCDQFAFGAVLYEMLAGIKPFHRDSEVLTMSAIVNDPSRPLAGVVPTAPDAVVAVVDRCLKKKRDDRFSATRDIALALRDARERSRSHSATRPALPHTRTWLGVGIAALLAAITGLAIWGVARSVGPATGAQQRQIVILPFATLGGDAASVAFSDGVVELLTTSLTQLEQFQQSIRVVPASDIRRAGITSAQEARKAFNATLVMSGSVVRTPERVRVTLNLIDAATLQQLKARVVNAVSTDVLAVQDSIVNDATSMLELELQPAARAMLVAGKSQQAGAFDAYLQGRGYLQRFERLDNVNSAIDLFERALKEDDNFALAHAALGEAYWRKYELTKDAALVPLARAECARAVSIDDRIAQVRVTLGLTYRGTGEYEAAVGEFTRALSIDRVNADAYRELGRAYEALGQFSTAEETYKQAIATRPGDWSSYSSLGRFYTGRARYQDALVQFGRVIELTPDNAGAYSNLGGIQFYLERYDDAARSFERSVSITPTAVAYSNLGTLYFRQGRFAESAAAFERGLQLNGTDYRVWGNLGAAYRNIPGQSVKSRDAYLKAVELAERERRVDPRRAQVAADIAEYSARSGDRSQARLAAQQAAALAPDANAMATIGFAYETAGDRADALEWLARAVAAGYPKAQLVQSKSIDELKKDPRFQDIIRP